MSSKNTLSPIVTSDNGGAVGCLRAEDLYQGGAYLELNPTWHVEDSAWKASMVFKSIQENHLQPTSVCEVGCGAGEILNQLQLLMPPSCSFAGYEISPQAYKLCATREKERLTFYCKDLLQDEGAYFGLVLAIDVFEHVEDYRGFLRQLRHRGEYKIFHIPLDLSVRTVLCASSILQQRQTVGHLHYFTKETALATLEDTGYEILDSFYTLYSNALPAQSLKRVVAKTARKIGCLFNPDLTIRTIGGSSLMVLAR